MDGASGDEKDWPFGKIQSMRILHLVSKSSSAKIATVYSLQKPHELLVSENRKKPTIAIFIIYIHTHCHFLVFKKSINWWFLEKNGYGSLKTLESPFVHRNRVGIIFILGFNISNILDFPFLISENPTYVIIIYIYMYNVCNIYIYTLW